jgi:hypothetical protein
MVLVCSIFLVAAFVVAAFHYWQRLVPEDDLPRARRWLAVWTFKGVVAPALVWTFLNSGVSARLPPLLPQVEFAKTAGGNWLGALADVAGFGLLLIGSYWAALTFAWLVVAIRAGVPAEQRGEFLGLAIVWGALLAPVAAAILYVGGSFTAGFATVAWLWPVAHATLPLVSRRKPSPLYSRAIAKMKFGKFSEAEWEVIRELEKCEDDFDGWMLLAELYANQFHDLPAAEQTIRDLCAQPNVTPSQVAVALHRLADWHLRRAHNPPAARAALEEICARYPGTHLDRMARQRLNQLPATREELRERQKGRTLRLPALRADLDEAAAPPPPAGDRSHAMARAHQLVEQLKRDPNAVPPRAELARVFAEQLGRTDLAIEQLELLLAMPDQPAGHAAEWLALMGAWHIRYRQDREAGRKVLERLVREFPQSPQAFAAQRRLSLMVAEEKLQIQWRLSSRGRSS